VVGIPVEAAIFQDLTPYSSHDNLSFIEIKYLPHINYLLDY